MAKDKLYPEDAQVVAEVVAYVEQAVPLMQVRGASASPAGRKIQARLVWRESGRAVIGYVSVHVPRHEPGKPAPPFPSFGPWQAADQACRVGDRARKAFQGKPDSWQRATKVHREVQDALTADPATLAGLQPLCDEMLKKMKAVHRAGGHQATRRAHNMKKARAALASTLDYVLSSGISDDDVKEMLKEALIRHTMES